MDTARGIAILLVVLYHAVLFSSSHGLEVGPWETVNRLLSVLRMPLFFLVSGLLIAPALDRPAADSRPRIAGWLWTYVLWSLVSFAAFTVVPWRRPAAPADSWWDLAAIVGWPSNGLWYLFALAIFLMVLLATRHWPPRGVVAAAAGLAVLMGTTWVTTGNFALDSMGQLFVFFALGARFPGVVAAAGQRPPRTVRRIAGPVYLLAAALVMLGWQARIAPSDLIDIPGVRLALSVLALGAGVALSVWLTAGRLGGLLGRLGRRTLPIYVAHEILLGALVAVLPDAQQLPHGAGLWLPVPLAGVTVAASCVLWRLLGGAPGLYAAPSWLTARLRTSPPSLASQPSGGERVDQEEGAGARSAGRPGVEAVMADARPA